MGLNYTKNEEVEMRTLEVEESRHFCSWGRISEPG
jgi:hypothetical protein